MQQCFFYWNRMYIIQWNDIGLATKRLRILSLGGNYKIRNHLVAKPILLLLLLDAVWTIKIVTS